MLAGQCEHVQNACIEKWYSYVWKAASEPPFTRGLVPEIRCNGSRLGGGWGVSLFVVGFMRVGVSKLLIQRWMGVGDGRMRLRSIRIMDVDRFDGRQGRRRGLGWWGRHRVRFYPGCTRDGHGRHGRLAVAAVQVLDHLI